MLVPPPHPPQRMHQGVIRDIEREEREKALVMASASAASVPTSALGMAAAAGGPLVGPAAAAACESGVCDLAQTRFRDPATGKVYTLSSEAAAPASAVAAP
jgi:hypothetical protein